MPPLAAVAILFVVGTGMLALLVERNPPSLLPALPAAVPPSHNHPPIQTQSQPTMLQRRHSPAHVATLLVLLLVPVASFLFLSTPTSHNIGNMARHMPLMMTLEEGEGTSSTTSTLEVPPLSPAAVEEEMEGEADRKAAETEASR